MEAVERQSEIIYGTKGRRSGSRCRGRNVPQFRSLACAASSLECASFTDGSSTEP